MSESADYTPAPHWKGYDFNSARASYVDNVVRRSYTDAVSKNVVATDLVPDRVVSKAHRPLVIVCDVTGSMGNWPSVIFSKLPYLEHEGKVYLGDDFEVCFAAVGDVFNDKYPLQVQPFASGVQLKESLEKLIIEGGGGATGEESYDIAGLYFARNCDMPDAIGKPILVFIGDEGIYNFIDKASAKNWSRADVDGLTPEKMFEELKKKFSVYIIRKCYGAGTQDDDTSKGYDDNTAVQKQWVNMLGADHVASLPTADRVVDVLFGILGKETGKGDYFATELKDRQMKDADGKTKINVVMKSLHSIHRPSVKKLPAPSAAKSVTRKNSASVGKKSISLLDDDDKA